MRLLIDESISWRVGRNLGEAGYDVVHVRDVGLLASLDADILQFAEQEKRIVVTQDTDFGTLLWARRSLATSIILLRLPDGRPESQAVVLRHVLPAIRAELTDGMIAVIGDRSIRLRRVP